MKQQPAVSAPGAPLRGGGSGSHPWRTEAIEALLETMVGLRTSEEAASFLRDLCTLHELEVLAQRWEVVRLLDAGLPYHEIVDRTTASSATVTRVAQWLRHGEGGYRRALDRLQRKQARKG